jgi:hypothetical protein
MVITVEDKTATIKGSYAALAQTLQKIKMGNLNNQVPSFIPAWCAKHDECGQWQVQKSLLPLHMNVLQAALHTHTG